MALTMVPSSQPTSSAASLAVTDTPRLRAADRFRGGVMTVIVPNRGGPEGNGGSRHGPGVLERYELHLRRRHLAPSSRGKILDAVGSFTGSFLLWDQATYRDVEHW